MEKNGVIISKLNPNKLDFIFSSIGSVYSNCELSKFIIDNDADEKCELEVTKCAMKILDQLFHGNKQQNDPYIGFFLNTIKSFHVANKCSSKTAICFSILLCKRISEVGVLEPKQSRKFWSYLKESLNKSILLMRDDSQIAIKLNSNIDKPILLGLCRRDETIGDLLFKLVHKLKKHDVALKRENIHVTFIPRSIADDFTVSRVKNGLIIPVESTVIKDKDIPYTALMIDSSLRYDYVHLGFNKDIKLNKYKSNGIENPKSSLEEWKMAVEKLLIRFNIDILFIRDRIDADLKEFCASKSILVVSNMELNLMNAVKRRFNVIPVTYIEDIVERNLFKVNLKPTKYKRHFKIIDNNSEHFTVLIETKLPLANRMLKENIDHNLKRLENVIRDGFYLKGAGFIDYCLSERILDLKADNNLADDSWLFDLAKQTLTNTFRDMNFLIRSRDEEIFDDYKSKIEAWKIGLFINYIFYNSDFSISY